MIQVAKEEMQLMLEAGFVYLAQRRFKEAKSVFEGVVELAPLHDIPKVALASVYFAESKYPEAIKYLKQALMDNPCSAYAKAHLGEALLFSGKIDEAKIVLTEASELAPTSAEKAGEFARSVLGLIAKGYNPQNLRKDFAKFAQANKGKK